MIDLVPCRRAIISGLIGTFLFRITKTDAAPRTLSIPKFESGRYQFTTIQPRRKLPSLTLFRLDGRTTDLSSLRGRPILLNFWATWCAACRTELPILDRLQAERRHTGLQILAVSEDRGGMDRRIRAGSGRLDVRGGYRPHRISPPLIGRHNVNITWRLTK